MAEFINSEIGSWSIVVGVFLMMFLFHKWRDGGSGSSMSDDGCDGDGGD